MCKMDQEIMTIFDKCCLDRREFRLFASIYTMLNMSSRKKCLLTEKQLTLSELSNIFLPYWKAHLSTCHTATQTRTGCFSIRMKLI